MFGPEQYQQMTELQRQLAEVLKRANDNRVPAHVAAYALARLTRQLLDFHPDNLRQGHCDVICAFLQGAQETSSDSDRLIRLH